MPDEILIATQEEIDSGRILPKLMQSDLLQIANLSTDKVEKVSRLLLDETGVVSDERLSELVQSVVIEEPDQIEAVVRTIRNVIPGKKRQFLEIVKHSAEKNSSLFSGQLNQLLTNLEILVKEYPGVQILRKAKRLSRITGNELTNAFFACDLRPVFDQDHNEVDAFVCLANLRLKYLRQNGEDDVFELVLTEDELEYLKEKIEDALSKIDVMKASVQNVLPIRGET